MKKIDYLDALRGIAVLGVIMVHTNQVGLSAGTFFDPLIYQGARGVQLFFIASAFTLFLSYNSRQKETLSNTSFFIRRFFRIAPMFYLAIAYYLWQDGFGTRYWLGNANSITPANIISTLTFTNSFNPYWITSIVPGGWSIAIEFLFYACLPLFIFRLVKNLNSAVVFFTISIAFSFVLNLFFTKNQLITSDLLWKDYLYLYFPAQLPVFAVGIICYFISMKKESLMNINQKTILILIGFAILQLSANIIFFQVHVLFSLVFGLLIIALSQKSYKLIVNRFTIFMGKLSFSLYLTHFAVLHWLDKFQITDFVKIRTINYCLRFILVLTLSTIIAYITYTFIEKPFIKIGSKIIHRSSNSAVQNIV